MNLCTYIYICICIYLYTYIIHLNEWRAKLLTTRNGHGQSNFFNLPIILSVGGLANMARIVSPQGIQPIKKQGG